MEKYKVDLSKFNGPTRVTLLKNLFAVGYHFFPYSNIPKTSEIRYLYINKDIIYYGTNGENFEDSNYQRKTIDELINLKTMKSTVTPIKKNKAVKAVTKKEESFTLNDEESGTMQAICDVLRASDVTDLDNELGLSTNGGSSIFDATVTVLEYCCAIRELGDISCKNHPALATFINAFGNSKKGITFMMNLNNNASCTIMKKVLRTCDNWTLVKSFKNSNSGNPIEIWMSNNE